jgi:hypothetical protein
MLSHGDRSEGGETPMAKPARDSTLLFASILFVTILALIPTAPAWAFDCGKGLKVCACDDTMVVPGTTLSRLDPVTLGPCPFPRALTVVADLDLGNRTIACVPGSGAAGIVIEANDITVKNGTVRDCDLGISTPPFGTTGTTILGLWLIDNVTNLQIIGAGPRDNEIRDNVAIGDGTNEGFVIVGEHNKLIGNRCEDHGGDGINVAGDFNVLEFNFCLTNGGDGIHVEGDNNKLNSNQARTNTGNGVFARPGVGGVPTDTNRRNYGTGNGLKNCDIDGKPPIAKKYC